MNLSLGQMLKVEDLIKEYLNQGQMMQIASVADDQPWICTVYFIDDDKHNLYWLSLPTRRHSQEIAKNSKIAVAIPVKFEKPVIGLQSEGEAIEVNDETIVADIMRRYVERYNSGEQFYDNFVAGKNQHKLYKFTPKNFVLFDEVNFPGDARQEIDI